VNNRQKGGHGRKRERKNKRKKRMRKGEKEYVREKWKER
jgi:hypothetical protein